MKKKKTSTSDLYTAELRTMGRSYTGIGTTALEAIEHINAKTARTSGILTVSKDGTHKERVVGRVLVTRAFSSAGMTREVALRGVASLFDGL